MEEIVLDKPTIKEMIDMLSTLPQDMKIIIEDADTLWTIWRNEGGLNRLWRRN